MFYTLNKQITTLIYMKTFISLNHFDKTISLVELLENNVGGETIHTLNFDFSVEWNEQLKKISDYKKNWENKGYSISLDF